MIAATIESIEALCWQEKWAMAIPLMQIFSIVAPIRLIPEIIHAAMFSRGQFGKSAVLLLAEGALLMFSAWLAVELFGSNLTQVALLIAFFQVAFSITLIVAILRGYGVQPVDVLAALLPVWVTSAAVAAMTVALSASFLTDVPLLVRLLLEIGLFSLLFLVLVRTLFSNQLDELASVVPRPLEGVVRRAFFLNRASAS
jgi:hypothetical protein